MTIRWFVIAPRAPIGSLTLRKPEPAFQDERLVSAIRLADPALHGKPRVCAKCAAIPGVQARPQIATTAIAIVARVVTPVTMMRPVSAVSWSDVVLGRGRQS